MVTVGADDERRLEEAPHRELRALLHVRQRRLALLAPALARAVSRAADHEEVGVVERAGARHGACQRPAWGETRAGKHQSQGRLRLRVRHPSQGRGQPAVAQLDILCRRPVQGSVRGLVGVRTPVVGEDPAGKLDDVTDTAAAAAAQHIPLHASLRPSAPDRREVAAV